MIQRFVYVARLRPGSEVELRRVLEHLPQEAFADAGFIEYTTYVGSGYCVLQFGLPDGDFQVQAGRYFNDPRIRDFHARLAEHLVEGGQIASALSAGDPRFHPGLTASGTAPSVTTSDLPLAAVASRWPGFTEAP